jgi:hypothetical protein
MCRGAGSAGLGRAGNGMIAAVGRSAGRGLFVDAVGLVMTGAPVKNQAVVNKS